MPIAVSVWRIDGSKAVSVSPSALADEKLLEDILEDDIGLLGLPNQLLVIGRQVVTDYSGRIDLLCVDQEGDLVVVEIKRDKTPREVVAQAMDYGYWVRDLGYDDVRDIYARYRPGGDFEDAFRATFDIEPPEEVNGTHQLVIVASALDAASERIVNYVQSFGAPVNVVFFQTFEENGTQYLTRTWLVDPVEEAPVRKPSLKKQQAPWNGRDWYVSFGEEGGARDWDDAQLYGFVSAGGGSWYIGTIKKLPIGGCVFVNLPGKGYVGVGVVTGKAVPARDFTVSVNGHDVPLTEAPLSAPNLITRAAHDDDETEWVVPVRWLATVPREKAISFKGRYGNQNSATRLTHALTRETVLERLGLTEADLDATTRPTAEAPELPLATVEVPST
jgi:Endonuclease NucS C-terminal domain